MLEGKSIVSLEGNYLQANENELWTVRYFSYFALSSLCYSMSHYTVMATGRRGLQYWLLGSTSESSRARLLRGTTTECSSSTGVRIEIFTADHLFMYDGWNF